MTMDDGNDEGRQWKAEATAFEGGLAPIGETGATNMPALGAMPGAVSSTGNLPLLVISGSILRDYLWLQAPVMARPGTASGMMVRRPRRARPFVS